jgi:hypothetical protein
MCLRGSNRNTVQKPIFVLSGIWSLDERTSAHADHPLYTEPRYNPAQNLLGARADLRRLSNLSL